VTPATSSVIYYTSVVTETPSLTSGTAPPTTIFLTSTAPQSFPPSSVYSYSSAFPGTASSSSTRSSALATVSADTSSKSSGLSSGGVIAVAVIVPIAVVVLLALGLLFFWKKRKARKAAEEERKKEIEEYGFNPNRDPTLAPVVAAAYAGNGSETIEDNSGYRGWGAASSTQRKASTHLSSGRGGAGGPALSDSSSNPGGYAYQGSGTTPAASEGQSGEPLANSDTMGAPHSQTAVAIPAVTGIKDLVPPRKAILANPWPTLIRWVL
jgi:hypothetical protein